MEFRRLGELVEVYDSLHKTPKEYIDEGYPMVRVKDVDKGFLNLNGTSKVSSEVYKEFSKKYTPKKGDIIFSRVGSYGIPCYVNTEETFCLGQNTVILHPVGITSEFLYYCLNSPFVQNQIHKFATGSTQKTISLKSIKELEIQFPSLKSQERIANILFSIDLKIEMNNNIIAKLDEISTNLFKRWFIDFEFPNEQGLPYRSNGGEMVVSELGEIPKGWTIYKLSEFAESISKSINKKEVEYARFLNTSDIEQGNIKKVDLTLTSEMPGQAKKLIQKGDILYSEIRPKNKRYAYVDFESDEYVVSTKLMVIRVNESIYSNKLLYMWLTQEETVNTLQQIAEDRSGTFPQITFSILSNFNFALPDREKLKKYEDVLIPFLDEILALEQENERLSILRDTLLPKLLSGEIEIPDESVVEPS